MGKLFKDYFSFTKKERRGIFAIVIVIILLIALPEFFHLFVKDEPIKATEFAKEIAILTADSGHSNSYSKKENRTYNKYTSSFKKEEPLKKEVFYFDPNTASENDWIRLGIRRRTAQTIHNYIAKGGKFYKPEDIKKIYGLGEADAKRLIPYVRIVAVEKKRQSNQNKFTETKTYQNKYVIQPVDINVADTSAFIALPGIGSVLSKRIVSFRDKLGGFYSVNQVAQTYNLPDSTFKKLKKYLVINSKAIKKININSASIDEMRAHPYISYNVANAIFQYRQQHGNFNSVEDLRKIMTITDEFFKKASPYLSVN